MKKLLLILLCVPLMFSCGEENKKVNELEAIEEQDDRIDELDKNDDKKNENNITSNWSDGEKNTFLSQCKQNASSYPMATQSGVNDYCQCCLEEMMLKYNTPTSEIDMQWVQDVSNDCAEKSYK
jgi:hypothetical protein